MTTPAVPVRSELRTIVALAALIGLLLSFCLWWVQFAVSLRDEWQAAESSRVAPLLEEACGLDGLAAAVIDTGRLYAVVHVAGVEANITGAGDAYRVLIGDVEVCAVPKDAA